MYGYILLPLEMWLLGLATCCCLQLLLETPAPAKGNMKKVFHQNEIINCHSPVCSFKRCMSVYIKPFAGY